MKNQLPQLFKKNSRFTRVNKNMKKHSTFHRKKGNYRHFQTSKQMMLKMAANDERFANAHDRSFTANQRFAR